jgi:hypothetical protein
MLKIDRTGKKFVRLNKNTMTEENLKERYDLQRMIRQSPIEFFAELGEELLLINEEICPTDFCDDRIDLLALDKLGAAVVIEIKRGSNKLQLLQAIAYAGMLSKWQPERFIEERSKLTGNSAQAIKDEIEEFLAEDAEGLGQSQRIILLAEGYDFEVLVTAEWLNENYGVDIRCYRLVLSADGTNEYVNCVCIYPPPELSQHAESRGGRSGKAKPPKWTNWPDALSQITNADIVSFYNDELGKNRENYLRERNLRYRIDGKIRWWVAARQNLAYVWQNGRFADDLKFWGDRLSVAAEVKPVQDGTCLRFFLTTLADCEKFRTVATTELTKAEFCDNGAEVKAVEN